MRISEKMGLVYTALFLTVSVAVITQNSEALMAAFRGESNVQAVDDIFTVRPGRDQKLFVLRNDVDAQNIMPSDLRLLSQPDCGTVSQIGGSFVYTSTADCAGYQAFTYCLDSGRSCRSASVALRLIEARDPIDSVSAGPITEMTGFETQVGFNSLDLEITNVRLGKGAAEETRASPVSGAKLASVAVEAPVSFRQPEPLIQNAVVRGAFSAPDNPGEGDPARAVVEVAALAQTQTDALSGNELVLPSAPASALNALLPAGSASALAARMATTGLDFRAPLVAPAIDRSPFGTDCDLQLSASPAPAAMIKLVLYAPCLPNTRIEIRHAKLQIAVRNGHTGSLTILIPALEKRARIAVYLADGTVLKAETEVPELEGYERVAIQWGGSFELDLYALEYGAKPGSAKNIWQGNPGNPDLAHRNGGGFLTQLGDRDVIQPRMAEIYSIPRSKKTKPGVVDFIVTAAPDVGSCGRIEMFQSYRSSGGRLVGATGQQFKLPDCGDKAQIIALKNAVRDLIIANK